MSHVICIPARGFEKEDESGYSQWLSEHGHGSESGQVCQRLAQNRCPLRLEEWSGFTHVHFKVMLEGPHANRGSSKMKESSHHLSASSGFGLKRHSLPCGGVTDHKSLRSRHGSGVKGQEKKGEELNITLFSIY